MVHSQQQRAVYLNLPKTSRMDITFSDLSYKVPNGRKGKKEILHGISGMFKCGEITAIMGPSGAGKSSLLNILSGFQKRGITGSIQCSGDEEKSNLQRIKYKKESCYILQDDRLCPLFTVTETMYMAANLKLGESLSEKGKDLLINDILDTLGLSSTVNTRCGRLSGGQRKRLSVALELIDNPPIMFLDEPTTGLDSSSSLQCITILKNLARGGRTIVCTIHQPSASIFEMFDHVYVLAEGHCVYRGSALNTVPFLSSVGLECPQYHNPADHLLEVANGEFGNFVDHLAQVTKDTNWRSIDNTNKMLDNEMFDSRNNDKTMVLIRPPSEFYKFRILIVRHLLQLYRDWTTTHLRIALHIMVGIFVGILYLNYGNDGSKTIKNLGYCIITLVYLIYTSLMVAIVNLPSQVPILKKESFNNWYKLHTYYLSYVFVHIPIQIFYAILHTTISYLITGQALEWNRSIQFVAIIVLATINAESVGVLLGSSVDPINGTFLGAILTALQLVVAGFIMLFSHMSNIMYCVSYASYIAYAFEGLMQALYRNRDILPCPDDVEYCHYTTPSQFLTELGMNRDNLFSDIAFLLCHIIVLKVLTFFVLRRTLYKNMS